jgi:hypothetical protein
MDMAVVTDFGNELLENNGIVAVGVINMPLSV